ncbi:MAG: hypothetical protein ACI81P_000299 [Neolewinella sp.]|jgi:hypothetical protein
MQARHYSQTYRRLRDLDPEDYQRIIRMYEEREDEIGRLDVLENFELTVYYVNALFATGAYRQHLMMVDLVIEGSIRHNIQEVDDIEGDVFEYLLFQKGASAYRLRDFTLTTHIAQELIRIDRKRNHYARFLRIALFKSRPRLLQFGRAIFILCLLLAAVMITANLVFVAHFFQMYEAPLRKATLAVFGVGCGTLIATYSFAYWRAHQKAFGFQRQQPNK